jgi:hypothetical protein
MTAGMFVCSSVESVWSCPETLPSHASVTVGGVHVACASALVSQLPWQLALPMQLGGVSLPSHVGAVAVPVHPPRHVAFAPQLTPPEAVIVQSPVQLPLQVPLQWTVALAASMQAASH